MAIERRDDPIKKGEQDYEEWRASLTDTPEKRAVYEEMAARGDLWLQLVEARQAAGLTQRELATRLGVSQPQVARIEKRGYEAYTLKSLRRYVQALGEGFSLELRVCSPDRNESSTLATINLDETLLAEAQRLTGLRERTALIREGLKALIERESARRLARLGGSEGALRPVPRRRAEPA